MLKTAIYGLLRVSLDLLHVGPWWWGLLTLGLGLGTGLYGAIFAAVQTDMKRLLAYSSIENIGLILAGIGLALMCRSFDMRLLAALALAAALIHAFNHALFKSLLFLATGSVMHATGERSLGKLGGLIRHMPWVATLALIGTLAIAGLPPLNGFVSEWLLLQAFLQTPQIPHAFLNMIVPLGAAIVTLTVALAGYVMVKFYGVIYLGQPREPALLEGPCRRHAGTHRPGLAGARLRVDRHVPAGRAGRGRAGHPQSGRQQRAARAVGVVDDAGRLRTRHPTVACGCGSDCCWWSAHTFVVVRRLWHGRLRRTPAWDCGYPWQTPRMQDTAEGFGQPIRHLFGPVFRQVRELPLPSDTPPALPRADR